MRNEPKEAKILAFPEKGSLRSGLRLVPMLPSEPTIQAWPQLPLDASTPPTPLSATSLEQALVQSLAHALRFLKALCGLPTTSLAPELKLGPLKQLEASQQSLLLTLELLRLGSLGDAEAAALFPGLSRAWNALKHQRDLLLLELDPRDRTALLAGEQALHLSHYEVEDALRLRSDRRVMRSPPETTTSWMALPGGVVLEQSGQATLDQRACRQRRLEQDFKALPDSLDVASCLEALPQPWLEGIARGLALPGIDDRWEQERRIRECLVNPRIQVRILQRLSGIPRRILIEILRESGNLRYDRLLLRYGADEETAWHWAEEVPTTPLEQLRRSGLIYVGVGRVGRKRVRLAIVPEELRESLKRQLARLVAV